MKTLDQIGLNYKSDKSSSFHNYLNIYDKYFSDRRNDNNNILEIGVLNGDSLNILSEYFINSKIIGMDILDKSHLNIKNCETIIGDQGNRDFLNKLLNIEFDIIIDDGSHRMDHQQITMGVLFRCLKNGGIYIIEDLHTSLPNYIETIRYGKSMFGLNDLNDNNTIDFLKYINGEIVGKNYYLNNQEFEYLIENIKSVNIFETSFRDDSNKSITSIIIKK